MAKRKRSGSRLSSGSRGMTPTPSPADPGVRAASPDATPHERGPTPTAVHRKNTAGVPSVSPSPRSRAQTRASGRIERVPSTDTESPEHHTVSASPIELEIEPPVSPPKSSKRKEDNAVANRAATPPPPSTPAQQQLGGNVHAVASMPPLGSNTPGGRLEAPFLVPDPQTLLMTPARPEMTLRRAAETVSSFSSAQLWEREDPMMWAAACGRYRRAMAAYVESKPRLKTIKAPTHIPKNDPNAGKPVNLVELDASVRGWHFSTGSLHTLAPEECHRRVCDIMMWKLSRGQFRPTLLAQCAGNQPQAVKKALIAAATHLSEGYLRSKTAVQSVATIASTAKLDGSDRRRATTPDPPGTPRRSGADSANQPPPPSPARLPASRATAAPPIGAASPIPVARRGRTPPRSPMERAMSHMASPDGLKARPTLAVAGAQSPLAVLAGATPKSSATPVVHQPLREAPPVIDVSVRVDAMMKAIGAVTALKGIGPATATAVLQQFQLPTGERGLCPFFADESAQAVLANGGKVPSLKYNVAEAKTFVDRIFQRHALFTQVAGPHDPVPTPAEMSHALWALSKQSLLK